MKLKSARFCATTLALTFALVAASCSDVESARLASDSDAIANDIGAGTDADMGMDADVDMDMDMGADADMDMSGDHSHEPVEWPAGMATPEISLMVTPHDDGSSQLTIGFDHFTIQSGDGSGDEPGTGHFHVIVDGRDSGMAFAPEVSLEVLIPGTHTVEIQLSSPSHGTYAINGQVLSFSTEFVISGEVTPVDATIEISVDHDGVVGGIVDASVSLGDLVEITIDSTIVEEFHLHVYDVTATLSPGETVTFRFVADIPGVFEAELEGASLQILNLEVK